MKREMLATKVFTIKARIRKLYFKHFSIIWAHSLGAQTGIPASKTLWICHCQLFALMVLSQ